MWTGSRTPTIGAMPYRAVASAALADWRAADRRMTEAEPDSAEWQSAYLDAEAAKAAYQEAVDAAHRERLPEPIPFTEAVDEPITTLTPPVVDGQEYGG